MSLRQQYTDTMLYTVLTIELSSSMKTMPKPGHFRQFKHFGQDMSGNKRTYGHPTCACLVHDPSKNHAALTQHISFICSEKTHHGAKEKLTMHRSFNHVKM